MPRVALIADSHFDSSSRWAECLRIHDWIAADLRDRRPDLIVHTGDVYERRSNPAERAAVVRWVQALAEIAPVLLVRGNHDAVGDLVGILPELRTDHPVVVEEAAGVHVLGGVVVAALAWPRRAQLAAMAGALDVQSSHELGIDVLRDVLRGLERDSDKAALRCDGVMEEAWTLRCTPVLFAGHVMVRGSRTSAGQPLVGCDFELGLEDLGLVGADAYALGHIHQAQDWTIDGAPVIYPGSPRRTAYGETEAKGYVLVDLTPGAVTWERVETPAVPMVLIEDRWDSLTEMLDATWTVAHYYSGAEIRLRYTVSADHREAARAAIETRAEGLRAAGAVDVKIEEVVEASTRARAPEVGAAAGLDDKLRALWEARDETPPEARAARLLERAHELEAMA